MKLLPIRAHASLLIRLLFAAAAVHAMQTTALEAQVLRVQSMRELSAPPATAPQHFNYVAPVIEETDYPEHALDMGIEGTSIIRMVLGPDSRIASCETVRSAGLAILDEQACRMYRLRGRFALREGLQHAVSRAPVTWRLGDAIPFNMFAMLDRFDRLYPDLRSGEPIPASLREGALAHCFRGTFDKCPLPTAPRGSWLPQGLALEPGELTIHEGRAAALRFRIDPRASDQARQRISARLGTPCRSDDQQTEWCAPRNWSVVLAGDVVTIAQRR